MKESLNKYISSLRRLLRRLLQRVRENPDLARAFNEGMIASEQAYPRDRNPYPVGTAAREWWDAGWSNALDELCGTFVR